MSLGYILQICFIKTLSVDLCSCLYYYHKMTKVHVSVVPLHLSARTSLLVRQ